MKFLKLFIAPIILSFVFSCGGEENNVPIINGASGVGAIPRLVNIISETYDLADIATTTYSHEVEFVTEDDGQNVEAYEVYIKYNDNFILNGVNSKPEVLFITYGQNDFGTSALGRKNIILNFPFLEVAEFLEIDPDKVEPGDRFIFSSKIILNDGRVFDSDNTDINVTNNLGEYFNWAIEIICPIEESLFTGMYTISYEGGNNPSHGPAYKNGEIVEIVALGSTSNLRSFSSDLFPDFGSFQANTNFELTCRNALYISADTGVNCEGEVSDNSIKFGPVFDSEGNQVREPLDVTDDSKIVLFLNEGANPGNCSLVDTQSKLTLTKM